MRIFVLYCLFLFPLSYVIAKNGYVEQNSVKYHFLTEQDTLYIETEKTEFETLYRLCFNQHDEKKVIFELKAVDDSNIDFVQSYTINGVRKFDCFAVYDNVADGNRFLFFDYENPVTDVARGDTITVTGCAFKTLPENSWAKDGNIIEWAFDGAVQSGVLGVGTPSID